MSAAAQQMPRVSFDRIAYAYDDYTSHPPAVAAQIGRSIAGIAGDRALVLELGIGTARIARPKPSASASVKSAGPCTWRTAHRNVQPTSGEGSG